MNINVFASSSAGNSYQVGNLLIEAGVPIKKIKQSLNYKLSSILGCLISHCHGDHVKGAKALMKAGVDCFVSHETAQAVGLKGHRLHIIKPLHQFQIGKWSIKPFSLIHDVPCLGFIISNGKEKILFATDTNYIPYRFKGLTHIMLGVDYDADFLKDNVTDGLVDTGRAKRTLQNHMSIQTAKDFFRANDMSKVREIYLLHLSSVNSNSEMFKAQIEAITGRPVYV